MAKRVRNFRQEYLNYHASPKQRARRAARNKSRRKAVKDGRVRKGDGKDIDHKDGNPANTSRSNLRVQSKSKNRSHTKNRGIKHKR